MRSPVRLAPFLLFPVLATSCVPGDGHVRDRGDVLLESQTTTTVLTSSTSIAR